MTFSDKLFIEAGNAYTAGFPAFLHCIGIAEILTFQVIYGIIYKKFRIKFKISQKFGAAERRTHFHCSDNDCKMKNKNFLQSVKCAVRGIVSGFKAERNFKIYACIAAVFLVLNILVSSGLYDYLILLSLTCGVFSAEYLNTAAERLCDSFCSEENKNIEFIKDVSAASVLVMGIAFFTAEGAILISNIL